MLSKHTSNALLAISRCSSSQQRLQNIFSISQRDTSSSSSSESNEKLEQLREAMERLTNQHDDTANTFDSIQEKFKMAMDNFNANLYLYPSYSNKIETSLNKIIDGANNTYDSTADVVQTINDGDLSQHAVDETLNKIASDLDKLKSMNAALSLFHDISVVLDEGTKAICEISKTYSVYSELNYHLHSDKVNAVHSMKPLFADIEELKDLKGPIADHSVENEVIGICYDGINQPSISPIWFKYDKSECVWMWSPFDPHSVEWDMFSHRWIAITETSIDGEIGGEQFDGSEPAPVNVRIIQFLHDYNPAPPE